MISICMASSVKTSQSESQNIDKSTLNKLARIAAKARVSRLDKSQVNNLLEMLYSTNNPELLLIYLARQAGRNEIDKDVARELYEILNNKNLNEAVQILGIFKWLFEAGERTRDFDQFLRQTANQNQLLEEYIKFVLRGR